VQDATIEVLNGPSSPIKGTIQSVDAEFSRSETDNTTRQLLTNERGTVRFVHEFRSAGNDGMFKDTGYISTNHVWVRITADGYQTTVMPVDGQSARPRDSSNTSPVFVTVPVGRR